MRNKTGDVKRRLKKTGEKEGNGKTVWLWMGLIILTFHQAASTIVSLV